MIKMLKGITPLEAINIGLIMHMRGKKDFDTALKIGPRQGQGETGFK